MINSLKIYVQRIKNLPTIPVVAQQVLSLVNDDLTSVDKLEKIIENDPAISAKILSVANSAFFGVQVPTKTLGSAIIRIGFNNVKSIAVGISLMTVLANGKKGRIQDYQRIFNHSVTVGFIARMIAKKLHLGISQEILMNGLLHDLGYLILNRYFPDNYQKVLNEFEAKGSLLEAEKEILDFHHTDMGAWLAEQWSMPQNVMDTTRYHHVPSRARKNQKLIALIHIADYIASRAVLAPTKNDPHYLLDETSLEILDIPQATIGDLETEVAGTAFLGEIIA